MPNFSFDYPGALTSQYQGAPKLQAWLGAALRKFDDALTADAQLDALFDLDRASGGPLDVLGALVGVSRVVGFQPSMGVSPVLDDGTFRLLIRAKIAQNQWDGRIDSLQGIWQSLFPGGGIIVQDSQNMTATVILSGVFTGIIQDLILNGFIVPRPEGVLYSYVFTTLPALGTDQQNAYISGLDLGHFI